MARLQSKGKASSKSVESPRRSRRLSDQAEAKPSKKMLSEATHDDEDEVVDISEDSTPDLEDLTEKRTVSADFDSDDEEEDSDDDAPEEEGFRNGKEAAAAQDERRLKSIAAQQARDKEARRKKNEILREQNKGSKRALQKEEVVVDIEDSDSGEENDNDDEESSLLSAELLEQFQAAQQNKHIKLDADDAEAAAKAAAQNAARAARLAKKRGSETVVELNKGPVSVQVLSKRTKKQRVMMPAKATSMGVMDEWLGRKTIDRRQKVAQNVEHARKR